MARNGHLEKLGNLLIFREIKLLLKYLYFTQKRCTMLTGTWIWRKELLSIKHQSIDLDLFLQIPVHNK